MSGDPMTETQREKKVRAGRIGGAAMMRLYGVEHFRQMGRTGGAKNAEKGSAHMAAIGRKGAVARWGEWKEQDDGE